MILAYLYNETPAKIRRINKQNYDFLSPKSGRQKKMLIVANLWSGKNILVFSTILERFPYSA
jgi:hypothetical protein